MIVGDNYRSVHRMASIRAIACHATLKTSRHGLMHRHAKAPIALVKRALPDANY
jgi:hypothetical protein